MLPYEKFSIRVSRHNLYRLFEILDSITAEELASLQAGLAHWHRWAGVTGCEGTRVQRQRAAGVRHRGVLVFVVALPAPARCMAAQTCCQNLHAL